MQLLTQHKGFSFFISFVVIDHTLIFFVDEVAVWVIFSFWGFSTQPLSPSHCASLFKDNRLAEECVQNLMKQCLRCCFARVWKRLLSTARKTLFVLHTQPAPSPKTDGVFPVVRMRVKQNICRVVCQEGHPWTVWYLFVLNQIFWHYVKYEFSASSRLPSQQQFCCCCFLFNDWIYACVLYPCYGPQTE